MAKISIPDPRKMNAFKSSGLRKHGHNLPSSPCRSSKPSPAILDSTRLVVRPFITSARYRPYFQRYIFWPFTYKHALYTKFVRYNTITLYTRGISLGLRTVHDRTDTRLKRYTRTHTAKIADTLRRNRPNERTFAVAARSMDDNSPETTDFMAEIRNDVEYVRHVPDKNNEFRQMMLKEEVQKDQNKTLEVIDDWSLYDNQYPRIGPIIFQNTENESSNCKADIA